MLSTPKSSASILAAILLSMAFSNSGQSFNFKPFAKPPQIPLTPLAASLQSASQIHDKWAIVIGVSTFKDPKILPIKYGANSAIKLSKVFLDPAIGHFKNDHMLLLQQEDATRETIDDVLANGIARKALPADMIILYISTRWMPSKNGKDIVFCATDTVADSEATGINLVAILKSVRKRTGCKNILCLLDLSPVTEGIPTDKLLTDAPRMKGQSELDIIGRLEALTNISIFSANNFSTSSAQTPFTESSYFARFLMEDLNGSGGGMPLDVFQPAVTLQVRQTVLSEQKLLQIPVSAPSPDFVANLAIGAIVGKYKSLNEIVGIRSTDRIGLDGGQLPIDHPELLPGAGIGIPVKTSGRPTRTRTAEELNRAGAPSSGSASTAGSWAKSSAGSPPAFSAAASAASTQALAKTYTATPTVTGPVPSLQTLLQQSSQRAPTQGKTPPQAVSHDETSINVDMRPYIANMKKAIQAKWQPPKGFEDRKLMTTFIILKDGTIQKPEVTESSGTPSVDRAALDALKASSPLPPLPASSPAFVMLRYRFVWRPNQK
jgi:TonB family protein